MARKQKNKIKDKDKKVIQYLHKQLTNIKRLFELLDLFLRRKERLLFFVQIAYTNSFKSKIKAVREVVNMQHLTAI